MEKRPINRMLIVTVLITIIFGMLLFLFKSKISPKESAPKTEESVTQITPTPLISKSYANIREVDFKNTINGFNETKGHRFIDPVYADLTNDSNDEAIVGYRYTKDGTNYDYLFLYVYTLASGDPRPMTTLNDLYKADFEVTSDKLLKVKQVQKTVDQEKVFYETWNFVTGEYKKSDI